MIFTGDGQQVRRPARRIVGSHQGLDSDRDSEPEGGTTSDRRPPRDERDHLPLTNGLSVGRDACGVRQRKYLLSPLQALARSWSLRDGSRRDAHLLRRQGRHRVGLGVARQRQRQGTKRGDLTGPNPTDRAKLGTKRHVLTDGQGIPLAVTLTGANVHDMHMVGATLDAVPLRAPRGTRRPKNLCLDKGYDYEKPEREAQDPGAKPHIRRSGEPAVTGPIP